MHYRREIERLPWRAADERAAVVDLDVLGRGLEQRRCGADELRPDLVARVGDRAARGARAPAREGPDAEGHGGRAAAGHRHPVERHAEGVGGDLREARLVALPRVHRARRDDDARVEVELDRGALEGADGRSLDVARDPDATVDSPGAQPGLLAAERVVPGGGERLLEHRGKVAGVVDEWVAVAVGHAEVVRELVGPDVVLAAELRPSRPELCTGTVRDS